MPKRANKYRDWEFARAALRQILRVWALDFSALELRTALFVYDRTIGWGKQWEVITSEQASVGVWNDEGECWAAPITKDKARARAALQALVDGGFLTKRQKGKSFEYALNLEMKVPKRLKTAQNNAQEGVRNRIFEGGDFASKRGAISHPKEYFVEIREAKDNISVVASLDADIPIAESVEQINAITRSVVVRARKRQDQRKKQGKFERRANGGAESGFVPFKSSLAIIWADLYRSVYPQEAVVSLPAITLRILYLYAKNWTLLRQHGEFVDYLTWIFENWSMLRAGPFKWMQDFPITPAPRILVSTKLRPLIEEAYQQKDWWSKWAKMDEYERRVQHLTVNKGLDRSKAESIAKRETGFRDEIEAIKQERRKLELAALRVKQAYEQERAALRKQQQRSGVTSAPSIKNVEGDFGKWDENDN